MSDNNEETPWLKAVEITVVSSVLLILLFALNLGTDNIRAIATWATMTAGIIGLHYAIHRFFMDHNSHKKIKLSLAYKAKI